MIETNLQRIVERLDKVEKQNRYMKLAGVFFLSVISASLLTGAAKKSEVTKEIKAQRIVMLDSRGRERIVMEEPVGGLARFKMLSFDGKSMFSTDIVGDQMVVMQFSNKQEENRIRIFAGHKDENGGCIGIVNKTGETVVELKADEYGNGLVGAYNRKGMGRTLQPGP